MLALKQIPFILLIIWVSCWSNPLYGQLETGKNALSVEFFGISQQLSISYHRKLAIKPHSFISGRVGVGIDNIGSPNIPHGVTYCRGKSKNFLEAGVLGSLGPTSMGYADASETYYVIAPMVGYRRHPSKGLLLQAFISPRFPVASDLDPEFYFGLAVGYVFRNKD